MVPSLANMVLEYALPQLGGPSSPDSKLEREPLKLYFGSNPQVSTCDQKALTPAEGSLLAVVTHLQSQPIGVQVPTYSSVRDCVCCVMFTCSF